ncbi:MAG: GIY-YIG nuclease family protein, partial [Candidatus Sericytochromatia bacterium]
LEQKLAEAEIRLHDAEEAKKRAISQAQLTKCGHVYVISNIGSFGEDVFKIGMTRRLDPMDRVKELGDASVPFPFDVHAMIYSEDAPGLENQLHKLFNESRLNRVNNRKEFFRVGLKDIEKAAHKFGATVEFTKIAEAKEYRESVAFEKLGKVTATSESSFEEEEIYA